MSDFLSFLIGTQSQEADLQSDEHNDAPAYSELDSHVDPVSPKEDPSFFDFIHEEFVEQAVEENPEDNVSFVKSESEDLPRKRSLIYLQTPSVLIPQSISVENFEENTHLAIEPPVVTETPAHLPYVDSQTGSRFRLRRVADLVKNMRTQPLIRPAAKRAPVPSLKAVGNFREKTAFEILQTLAEQEDGAKSETSEEAIKELRKSKVTLEICAYPGISVDSFATGRAASESLPQQRQIILTSQTGNKTRIDCPHKKANFTLKSNVAVWAFVEKKMPRLRKEQFNVCGLPSQDRVLRVQRGERLELFPVEKVDEGVRLGLDLDNIETKRMPPQHMRAQCDCPLHRHRIRVV
jgi:hypothetical protein